jgi:hypothetical protein
MATEWTFDRNRRMDGVCLGCTENHVGTNGQSYTALLTEIVPGIWRCDECIIAGLPRVLRTAGLEAYRAMFFPEDAS